LFILITGIPVVKRAPQSYISNIKLCKYSDYNQGLIGIFGRAVKPTPVLRVKKAPVGNLILKNKGGSKHCPIISGI